MGGTKYRMREFAEHIAKNVLKKSVDLVNLTKHSHRYAMFKVGPVLSVNVSKYLSKIYITAPASTYCYNCRI